MLKRIELWLLDQLDYFYGLERLALRAGLSPIDAKRVVRDHRGA
jgi:hypothetical protein